MTRLNDHQRTIADKHYGLLTAFMKRNRVDKEEYYGDLAVAYCTAIAGYDESKGAISTYIYAALSNKMKNIYRAKTFEKTLPPEIVASMEQPVSQREGAATLAQTLPDRGLDVEQEVMFRLGWEEILRKFTPLELEILNNIIYGEHTQREYAAIYRTSQTSYARWEKAVRIKAIQILFGSPS